MSTPNTVNYSYRFWHTLVQCDMVFGDRIENWQLMYAATAMKLPLPHFDLENRLAYRFSMLSNISARSTTAGYKRQGLTLSAWKTFSLIGHCEPVHPGDVARRQTADADNVTRVVDGLVQKGLVARAEYKGDRRRVVLSLTARGRRTFAQLEGERRKLERELLSVLTPAEVQMFKACLDRLESKARELFRTKEPRRRQARR